MEGTAPQYNSTDIDKQNRGGTKEKKDGVG